MDKKYRVSGHSMYPLLRDGDTVFVRKQKNYISGDIVVAEHPFRKMRVVKMVGQISKTIYGVTSDQAKRQRGAGAYHRGWTRSLAAARSRVTPLYCLVGLDSIESEDSRSFGAIVNDAIVGKVVAAQ